MRVAEDDGATWWLNIPERLSAPPFPSLVLSGQRPVCQEITKGLSRTLFLGRLVVVFNLAPGFPRTRTTANFLIFEWGSMRSYKSFVLH
jgi:hypothetical protein